MAGLLSVFVLMSYLQQAGRSNMSQRLNVLPWGTVMRRSISPCPGRILVNELKQSKQIKFTTNSPGCDQRR